MRKAELDMMLVRAIEHAISQVVECRDFSVYAKTYFQSLEGQKIWPIAKQLEKHSISTILESMQQGFPTDRILGRCKSDVCLCQMSKFRDAMWAAKEQLIGNERGLCLDCVKRGSGPDPGVGCR